MKRRQTTSGPRDWKWLGLPLGCVAVGVLWMSARAHPQSVSTPTALHHLSMVGASDPGFDAAIQNNFPGVSQVAGYQAIKPLLAILNNDSPFAINAYVVKWVVIDSQGVENDANLPVMQAEPAAFLLSGESPVLKAGETRLISPFFTLGARDVQQLVSEYDNGISGMSIKFQVVRTKPLVSALPGASSVRTTLDGVVFVDGLSSGPNTSNLFERLESEQQGEVDEATWMLSLLATGVTDQQIKDQLSQQIYAGSSSTGTDSASLHTAAVGRQARRFLSALESRGGQAELKRIASKLAGARPMTLQRQTDS